MNDIARVPEGWSLVSLGQLMKFQNGFNTDKTAYGRGLRFANVLEVITNTHLSAQMIPGRVATSAAESARYLVQRGDVLFNRTSETQEEVGLASVYLDDEPILFGGFVLRGKPISDAIDPVFAGYGLRSKIVRQQIMAAGQGGIRANIGQKSLSQIKIALPDKPEQEAIAEALSDADALIEGLERLIAKKRLIKLGAMQDLLTAKRRLPGLSREWKNFNLASSSHLKARIGWQGLTTQEYRKFGEHILVTGTDIVSGRVNWRGCVFVDKWRFDQDRNIQLRDDDILLTKDGTIGKVARVTDIPGPAALNSGVFVIRPKNGQYHPGFVFHILSSSVFGDFLAKLTAGSTIVHLYQKDLVTFEFPAPDFEEQEAISKALDDMDAEIQALDTRLEKARQVKEGMMQNLLTGRIRLV